MPCPFECLRSHALVLGAGARFFGSENLGVRTHEPAQKLRVLVVNVGNLLGAKKTSFFNLLLNGHKLKRYVRIVNLNGWGF